MVTRGAKSDALVFSDAFRKRLIPKQSYCGNLFLGPYAERGGGGLAYVVEMKE